MIILNKRLFIIGNGFDLAHNLPTKFNPNFREIAERKESDPLFWELYQSESADIWSDFENLLAKPDFNFLEEIFDAYSPDYMSDSESDRDAIIVEAKISGNLENSLAEFAQNAEFAIDTSAPNKKFVNYFAYNDKFIIFNYTHTLERLYGIEEDSVLHIHGAVGENELILGYPKGNFTPEKYSIDVMDGRSFREESIKDYIESIEDFYVRTAFSELLDKTEGFSKDYDLSELNLFLGDERISSIEVIGHSYRIDFPYFELLNEHFPDILWVLRCYDEDDREAAILLTKRIGIVNYRLVEDGV